MKVFDSRKPYPTKADLERVLTISEIFDYLESDRQYTLRQIATDAKAIFNLGVKEIEDSLKKVNDIINILDRTGSSQSSSGRAFCYLYSRRLGSAEAKEALEKYNSEHYKTPLRKLSAVKSCSLEDF